MREQSADLWTLPGDAICITTNGMVSRGSLIMGGGCAREALERFPDVALVWGQMTLNFGPGVYVYEPTDSEPLVSFPMKYHWKDPSDLDLIVKSSKALVDVTNHRGWQTVLLPRPGVGLGRLDYKDVKAAIGPILDDRFVAVSYPGENSAGAPK